jgi:hypothetical protein
MATKLASLQSNRDYNFKGFVITVIMGILFLVPAIVFMFFPSIQSQKFSNDPVERQKQIDAFASNQATYRALAISFGFLFCLVLWYGRDFFVALKISGTFAKRFSA